MNVCLWCAWGAAGVCVRVSVGVWVCVCVCVKERERGREGEREREEKNKTFLDVERKNKRANFFLTLILSGRLYFFRIGI